MDPEKIKIVISSLELFKSYGVKAVTMDQISQNCGISKKTLYKHFSNKVDLMQQAFDFAASQMGEELNANLAAIDGNAIDQLFALEQFAEQKLRGDEDRLLAQLDLYYPEVARAINAKRESIVSDITKANLHRGILEGIYRNDINVEYITILYYGHILAVHETIVAKESLNLNELRKASLRYHIRGIASLKGLEYLNQRIHQNNSWKTHS